MSWGSDAAGTAGTASNAAGSAGGSAGSAVGSGVSSTAAAPAFEASGYGLNAADANMAGEGVNMTSAQTSDMASYGSANPSFMDKAESTLERFQSGKENGMMKAYDKFGNNPETYGYLAAKIPQGGGGNQPANVTTNINYQQPQNDYLRKRRGY